MSYHLVGSDLRAAWQKREKGRGKGQQRVQRKEGQNYLPWGGREANIPSSPSDVRRGDTGRERDTERETGRPPQSTIGYLVSNVFLRAVYCVLTCRSAMQVKLGRPFRHQSFSFSSPPGSSISSSASVVCTPCCRGFSHPPSARPVTSSGPNPTASRTWRYAGWGLLSETNL